MAEVKVSLLGKMAGRMAGAARLAAGWGRGGYRRSELPLTDGARIAVIGGGPAGSFFSYFLLETAERIGMRLGVDIYEPKDFARPGQGGCNKCGGIISESLIQMLAMDGIFLPATVVRQGIDAYVLHTDDGPVPIKAPGGNEKRIASVRRGAGPAGLQGAAGSFDDFLLKLAASKGARVLRERVEGITFPDGKPRIKTGSGLTGGYDLLVGAAGVKSSDLNIFEGLGIGYGRPGTTRTFITEVFLGEETVEACLGNTIHIFLLNLPRLKFAAIIPKGEFATVCLMGTDVDQELVDAFFGSPQVISCFPAGWTPGAAGCRCFPLLNMGGTKRPFADRLVMIGDCGVSRLCKDGIGAAYRTAKAAADTVLFSGVAANDFRRHYLPVCRTLAIDNRIGKLIFAMTRLVRGLGVLRQGMLRMISGERSGVTPPRMSGVLWDVFTGSSTYGDVFRRMLQPSFIGRWLYETVNGCLSPGRPEPKGESYDAERIGKNVARWRVPVSSGRSGRRYVRYKIWKGRSVPGGGGQGDQAGGARRGGFLR